MQPCVFIHTNHRQYVGALVSAYSMRRASPHAERFEVKTETGIVSQELLREEMRRNHVRHDAFELIERAPPRAA